MEKNEISEPIKMEKLELLVDQVNREIAKDYVPGTRKWILENEPDLNRSISRSEELVNKFWKEVLKNPQNISAFIKALREYRQLHFQAKNAFSKHP